MDRVITSIRYSIICCNCKKNIGCLTTYFKLKKSLTLESLHDLRPTPPLPLDTVHHIFQEVPSQDCLHLHHPMEQSLSFAALITSLTPQAYQCFRVYSKTRGTGFCSFYCSFIMKVNICDNWNIDFFNNFFRAKLDSSSGHELNKSAPTFSSDLIWFMVALISVVRVFVID